MCQRISTNTNQHVILIQCTWSLFILVQAERLSPLVPAGSGTLRRKVNARRVVRQHPGKLPNSEPPRSGARRIAARAAAAYADAVTQWLAKAVETWKSRYIALANSLEDPFIADRMMAIVPALSALLRCETPLPKQRLRRNAALGAEAHWLQVVVAPMASLCKAQRGARLGCARDSDKLDELLGKPLPQGACALQVAALEALRAAVCCGRRLQACSAEGQVAIPDMSQKERSGEHGEARSADGFAKTSNDQQVKAAMSRTAKTIRRQADSTRTWMTAKSSGPPKSRKSRARKTVRNRKVRARRR